MKLPGREVCLYLAPRSGMSGATGLRPPYAFMAFTELKSHCLAANCYCWPSVRGLECHILNIGAACATPSTVVQALWTSSNSFCTSAEKKEFVLLNVGLRLIECKKFCVANNKAVTYYKFSFNRNVTSLYSVEPLLPVFVEGVKLREFACNQLKFRIREGLAISTLNLYRSQWPRDLRRGSAAARSLELWVRIRSGARMSVVSVVCCQVEVSA
jgi:hypothetical protein